MTEVYQPQEVYIPQFNESLLPEIADFTVMQQEVLRAIPQWPPHHPARSQDIERIVVEKNKLAGSRSLSSKLAAVRKEMRNREFKKLPSYTIHNLRREDPTEGWLVITPKKNDKIALDQLAKIGFKLINRLQSNGVVFGKEAQELKDIAAEEVAAHGLPPITTVIVEPSRWADYLMRILDKTSAPPTHIDLELQTIYPYSDANRRIGDHNRYLLLKKFLEEASAAIRDMKVGRLDGRIDNRARRFMGQFRNSTVDDLVELLYTKFDQDLPEQVAPKE